jgi:hypothetical protein
MPYGKPQHLNHSEIECESESVRAFLQSILLCSGSGMVAWLVCNRFLTPFSPYVCFEEIN